MSRTERVTKPAEDRPAQPSPTLGPWLIRARVGLNPKSPQDAAGIRVEPAPSEACAAGSTRAATAAAEPPEDPPEVRSRFQGLRVGPP